MVYDWLFRCVYDGPPPESALTVIEDDYRFTAVVGGGVRVEFIMLVYERRLLVKRFLAE